MPLEHVANVGVQDAKTLIITPWDKAQIPAIEKGIQAANIGLNPSSDGQVIRIILPAMTEERRKEMAKAVGQMLEKARVSVRGVREEIIKEMKKMEGESGISKDKMAELVHKHEERQNEDEYKCGHGLVYGFCE
jgi:ribosome recycling factor